MEHTETCKQAQVEYRDYQEKHPLLCKKCQGYGLVDASDASVGLESEEPCLDCFAKGKCPRCASIAWKFSDLYDSRTFECCLCGWKEGTQGAPFYECSCWETTINEYDYPVGFLI